MKVKTMLNITKGIAVCQAVLAPGLIVAGHVLDKPKMKKVGIIWSAWVTLDTARTTCNAIDNLEKLYEIDNDDELF